MIQPSLAQLYLVFYNKELDAHRILGGKNIKTCTDFFLQICRSNTAVS